MTTEINYDYENDKINLVETKTRFLKSILHQKK